MKAMVVYILTNTNNTTLYVGVTNDIIRRVEEHRVESRDSFAKRYNLTKLVYYEMHHDPEAAIKREKQLKAGSRAKKEALIQSMNPGWLDLFERFCGEG